MNAEQEQAGVWGLFTGSTVWFGILLALVGFLCEQFLGSEHAFEILMFFGGLNLGLGLGVNIARRRASS